MTRNRRQKQDLNARELQAIMFIATLVLAGIAIILHVNEPVVWSFLGTAIGIAIGQAAQSNHQR